MRLPEPRCQERASNCVSAFGFTSPGKHSSFVPLLRRLAPNDAEERKLHAKQKALLRWGSGSRAAPKLHRFSYTHGKPGKTRFLANFVRQPPRSIRRILADAPPCPLQRHHRILRQERR